MAASDAKLFVERGVATRITVPIFDTTGALVTGGAGLAARISLDAAAHAATTNAPVEIAASMGMYYLDLTAAETNAQTLAIKVTSSTAGAVATPVVIYTVRQPPATAIRHSIAQAGAAGTITLDASASANNDFYNEQNIIIIAGTGAGQSRVITDYVGATKVANVNRNWSTNPSSDSEYLILSGADIWDQPQGAEPTGAFAATDTMGTLMKRIVRRFYNRVTQTAAVQTIYKDDGITAMTTQVCSDDGTTQVKGASV